MVNFADFVAQDRRLVILRVLADQNVRKANHLVLKNALVPLGYQETSITIGNDLLWLGKQGLVAVEHLPGGVILAHISELGEQVALGLARVQGVASPVGA